MSVVDLRLLLGPSYLTVDCSAFAAVVAVVEISLSVVVVLVAFGHYSFPGSPLGLLEMIIHLSRHHYN